MTVPWNIGDRIIKVGQPVVYVIETFRRDGNRTVAIVRIQHSEERREIPIDVATPILYQKVG